MKKNCKKICTGIFLFLPLQKRNKNTKTMHDIYTKIYERYADKFSYSTKVGSIYFTLSNGKIFKVWKVKQDKRTTTGTRPAKIFETTEPKEVINFLETL